MWTGRLVSRERRICRYPLPDSANLTVSSAHVIIHVAASSELSPPSLSPLASAFYLMSKSTNRSQLLLPPAEPANPNSTETKSMASLAPRNFSSPSSSAYSSSLSSANRFQSAADRGPVVVAMVKRDAGEGDPTPDFVRGAMMDSDSKQPWWAPIFGIGRETTDPAPESSSKAGDEPEEAAKERRKLPGPARAANRSGLTAEKARLLRKELRATESWHDAMYHSAIASRLACPDQL